MEEDISQAIKCIEKAISETGSEGSTAVAKSLGVIKGELEEVRNYITRAGERYSPLPHEKPTCSLHGEVDESHRCRDFDGMTFDYPSWKEAFSSK